MKEGWTFLNFEDCIEKCKKTKQLKTSDYLPEGKYPIVSQESDLISGYTNMADYVNDFGKPIVVFGDHSRVVKYIDFAFAVGADGVKILIPTNDFYPKFFYYYLHWHGVENLGYSRHYKLLKEINVPIPTLSEQQHIVEELDLLSSIIEKKKAQLNELDNLSQSLFYEMFGDPITNEKGWKTKSFKDIATFKNGLNYHPIDNGQIINCIGVGDFQDRKELRDFKQIKTFSISETIDESYYLQDGDIIIVRSNGSRELVGRTLVVYPKDKKITYSGFCIRCRVSTTDILPFVLNRILSNRSTMIVLRQEGRGCNISNINQKILASLSIIMPPIELQKEYAIKVKTIEHQKELVKQSIKEVETLFNSRMDYYFN